MSLLQPQRWEQSLSDIHHPLPADSLIPMFEGMVDRALSRTQPEAPLPQELDAAGTASGERSQPEPAASAFRSTHQLQVVAIELPRPVTIP